MEVGFNADVDHRPADLWSFGKIIWTTLTGRRPLQGADQLRPENRLTHTNSAYARLDSLCGQMLENKPTDRLQDWGVVLIELNAALDDVEGRVRPDSVVIDPDRRAAAVRAAERFRTSPLALASEARKVRAQRDGTSLSELGSAIYSAAKGQNYLLDGVREILGESISLYIDIGHMGLADAGAFGIFDPILPLNDVGIPDRNCLNGGVNGSSIVALNSDEPLVHAGLCVWLVQVDSNVWAVTAPFVTDPVSDGRRWLMPPVLTDAYSRIDGPAVLGLSSSVELMEEVGQRLVDVFLGFATHALAILARGDAVHDHSAWLDELKLE
jgi:hypothetical protein